MKQINEAEIKDFVRLIHMILKHFRERNKGK